MLIFKLFTVKVIPLTLNYVGREGSVFSICRKSLTYDHEWMVVDQSLEFWLSQHCFSRNCNLGIWQLACAYNWLQHPIITCICNLLCQCPQKVIGGGKIRNSWTNFSLAPLSTLPNPCCISRICFCTILQPPRLLWCLNLSSCPLLTTTSNLPACCLPFTLFFLVSNFLMASPLIHCRKMAGICLV